MEGQGEAENRDNLKLGVVEGQGEAENRETRGGGGTR